MGRTAYIGREKGGENEGGERKVEREGGKRMGGRMRWVEKPTETDKEERG